MKLKPNKLMRWAFKKMAQAKKKWEKREKRKVYRELVAEHRRQIETRETWIRFYYALQASDTKAPIKLTCERFHIDRKTFGLWLKRYEENGRSRLSLIDFSHRPKTIRFKVPVWAEVLILIARLVIGWGAERLAANFKRRKIFAVSHQGVHNIFTRYGVSSIKRLHEKKVRRYERKKPNELWHIDIKGPFYIKSVGKIYTIGIIDDYSRYLIRCELRPNQEMERVIEALTGGIKRHGKPEEIINDNGLQFVSVWDGVLNGFQELLSDLGIKQIRCRIHTPETNGKIERFWQTLEHECFDRHYFTSLEGAQQEVNKFVKEYNNHRFSKALGWKTPAERYLGIENRDRGFKGLRGFEWLDGVYRQMKTKEKAEPIPATKKELQKVYDVVEGYRKAA